ADPGADGLPLLRRREALALRRPLPARARGRALLHAAQDHHLALADRHPQGGRVCDADDAVAAVIASRRRSNPDLAGDPGLLRRLRLLAMTSREARVSS